MALTKSQQRERRHRRVYQSTNRIHGSSPSSSTTRRVLRSLQSLPPTKRVRRRASVQKLPLRRLPKQPKRRESRVSCSTAADSSTSAPSKLSPTPRARAVWIFKEDVMSNANYIFFTLLNPANGRAPHSGEFKRVGDVAYLVYTR